jgi:hypothetical protein
MNLPRQRGSIQGDPWAMDKKIVDFLCPHDFDAALKTISPFFWG